MRSNTERLAWFNGEMMPESEVRISFRDRGWLYGDTAFDVARTFGGEPFMLREHLERLYRSLRYLRLDPGYDIDEMEEISRQVVAANRPLLEPGGEAMYVRTPNRSGGISPSTTRESGSAGSRLYSKSKR